MQGASKDGGDGVAYIPPDQWLDYSQSSRSALTALPSRRGMPMGRLRLDQAGVSHNVEVRPTTGSRAQEPHLDSSDTHSPSPSPEPIRKRPRRAGL